MYDQILAKLLPYPDSLSRIEKIGQSLFAQPPQAIHPLHYPISPMQCEKNKKPLNIIMVVIDSWRFDRLNSRVTPNLYRFSKKSQVFNNHFSGGNATQAGTFSLFYGLPMSYWDSMRAAKQAPILFTVLKKQNYNIQAIASGGFSTPAFDQTVFLNIPKKAPTRFANNSAKRDRFVTNNAIDFLKNTKKNFFYVTVL